MRLNRIRMPVDSFHAIEALLDELDDYLDDYFVDYANPVPSRIEYTVHQTVQLGHHPNTQIPRFHGLGLHEPIQGDWCPYPVRVPREDKCPYPVSAHQDQNGKPCKLAERGITHWATTYPGVVLDLQGQRLANVRQIGLQIAEDFGRLGVTVIPATDRRFLERSPIPGALWHLTVTNGYGYHSPHIHFNFDRRSIF